MTKILSARSTKCNWCVTSKTAFSRNTPLTHLLNTSLATCASKAERGSSIMTKSASAYTARAMAHLCFWPPLKVIPFSPICVWSASGRSLRSVNIHAASKASWYFLSECSLPNKIFSFTEADWTHADWEQYATVPSMEMTSSESCFSSPLLSGTISPRSAETMAVFPEPTAPTTHTSSPRLISKSHLFDVNPAPAVTPSMPWGDASSFFSASLLLLLRLHRNDAPFLIFATTSPFFLYISFVVTTPKLSSSFNSSNFIVVVVGFDSESKKYFCNLSKLTIASADNTKHLG